MKCVTGPSLFCHSALLAGALALPAALAVAQPAGAPPAAPTAAVKIGFIDVHRLIQGSPQMADARAQIEREFATRDAAIKAGDAKLAALKQRYERDGAIMTHDDAEALKREIEATERANKRMQDEARADLNERGGKETTRVIQLITNTAIEYARSQGYDMVIGSESALFATPRVDITDAVLQRLKQAAGAKQP